jgi:hypothetical protein
MPLHLLLMGWMAADGKQAVLFAFQQAQQLLRPAPTIYLRGLDARALYRLKPIDDKLVEKQLELSGSYLMNHGLNFQLTGDFDSTSLALVFMSKELDAIRQALEITKILKNWILSRHMKLVKKILGKTI